MTLEEFNKAILDIAWDIIEIRQYSYGRNGGEFNPRNPDRFLYEREKQHIASLEKKAEEITAMFKAQKKTK